MLLCVCVQAGPVEKVFIPLDPSTGHHKTHGFVEFEHKESIPYSILLLSGVNLCGRPLRVGTVGKESLISAAKATDATDPPPDSTEGTPNEAPFTSEDVQLQAAILAAQIQLGVSLPEGVSLSELGEVLLSQSTSPAPTPLFGSTNDALNRKSLPLVAPGAPTPLFSSALPAASSSTRFQTEPPQTPCGPPSGPIPLVRPAPVPLFSTAPTNGDTQHTSGRRLFPPQNGPTPLFNRVPHPSSDNEVCNMPGQKLSSPPPSGPTPLFGCTSLWEQDHVTNGNSDHLWGEPKIQDGGSNHSWNSRDQNGSWEQPPRRDNTEEQLFEEQPEHNMDKTTWDKPAHAVVNSDEIFLSPSPPWNPRSPSPRAAINTDEIPLSPSPPWSPSPPPGVADERRAPISPWEQAPNACDDVPSAFRHRLSPRHDHTPVTEITEFSASCSNHDDNAMFAEPHRFASEHTHSLHQNRILHIDDKPSWVTKETKDQIRNHHLSKLTETLLQYQKLYSSKEDGV